MAWALTFPGSSILSIVNWDGTTNGQLGDATDDQLIFTGSISDFTSKFSQFDVSFNSRYGYAVLDRGDGTFEVVPEPSTWLLGATALSLAGLCRRRRRSSRPVME